MYDFRTTKPQTVSALKSTQMYSPIWNVKHKTSQLESQSNIQCRLLIGKSRQLQINPPTGYATTRYGIMVDTMSYRNANQFPPNSTPQDYSNKRPTNLAVYNVPNLCRSIICQSQSSSTHFCILRKHNMNHAIVAGTSTACLAAGHCHAKLATTPQHSNVHSCFGFRLTDLYQLIIGVRHFNQSVKWQCATLKYINQSTLTPSTSRMSQKPILQSG